VRSQVISSGAQDLPDRVMGSAVTTIIGKMQFKVWIPSARFVKEKRSYLCCDAFFLLLPSSPSSPSSISPKSESSPELSPLSLPSLWDSPKNNCWSCWKAH
jgi:hypothetical protein